MEKKSRSLPKNDPQGIQILNAEEAGQKVKTGKHSRVKTIGDPEFDQVIDSLIHEMVRHS